VLANDTGISPIVHGCDHEFDKDAYEDQSHKTEESNGENSSKKAGVAAYVNSPSVKPTTPVPATAVPATAAKSTTASGAGKSRLGMDQQNCQKQPRAAGNSGFHLSKDSTNQVHFQEDEINRRTAIARVISTRLSRVR
jgi:hypothetical protein